MDSGTDGWMDGNYQHDHYHHQHQHYNHQHRPQLREWKYQVEFPCKNLKYTKGKKSRATQF